MLISCPECGTEISSKTPACPKCGYPLREEEVETAVKQKKVDDEKEFNGIKKWLIAVIVYIASASLMAGTWGGIEHIMRDYLWFIPIVSAMYVSIGFLLWVVKKIKYIFIIGG